jgi:hypothetical protein
MTNPSTTTPDNLAADISPVRSDSTPVMTLLQAIPSSSKRSAQFNTVVLTASMIPAIADGEICSTGWSLTGRIDFIRSLSVSAGNIIISEDPGAFPCMRP